MRRPPGTVDLPRLEDFPEEILAVAGDGALQPAHLHHVNPTPGSFRVLPALRTRRNAGHRSGSLAEGSGARNLALGWIRMEDLISGSTYVLVW